jgi:putative addiction module component (TIGR02574 family)
VFPPGCRLGACYVWVVTRRDVLQAALALPEEERVKLVEEIAESLPAEEEEYSDEFIAMLNERSAAFDRGEPGIPADEVFRKLRQR